MELPEKRLSKTSSSESSLEVVQLASDPFGTLKYKEASDVSATIMQ